MNERKKGAILSYIQVFLSVVVSMIYVPVLLHFLGQSEYGLSVHSFRMSLFSSPVYQPVF